MIEIKVEKIFFPAQKKRRDRGRFRRFFAQPSRDED
jgi:hypothetical protein